MSTQSVLGIDGCPGGWVAVAARGGRFAGVAVYPDVATLAAAHPGAAVLAIDIPLSFARGRRRRRADVEAKRLLGRKGSSLFPVPPRRVLAREPYAAANALSKKTCGRGISSQTYALRAKILEATRYLRSSKTRRLYEVHPELSFHLLARQLGAELDAPKRTWTGFASRYALLERVGLAPPLAAAERLGRAAPDDVLDAAVAAWSAGRIARRQARAVGAEDDPDPWRRRDVIWA